MIVCFPHCTGELGILKMLRKISIFATPNDFWLLAASCSEALGSSPLPDFLFEACLFLPLQYKDYFKKTFNLLKDKSNYTEIDDIYNRRLVVLVGKEPLFLNRDVLGQK